MSAASLLTASVNSGLGSLGYDIDRVIEHYEFPDVGEAASGTHRVRLAAFTHSPASYRSAAFGVIADEESRDGQEHFGWLGSLGAPVVFMVQGGQVHVMKVGRDRAVTSLAILEPDDVEAFIVAQREWWSPDAMRRFKLLGNAAPPNPQLDFFDAGLLPDIEGKVHARLNVLLTEVMDHLRVGSASVGRPAMAMVFRMLAAKVLLDRRHPAALSWKADSASVLKEIGDYYGLKADVGYDETLFGPSPEATEAAWSTLRSGLSLRNVSSDDLAFIYEHSFVSEEARVDLGTHNTPRSVVEYACDRLPFARLGAASVKVFEPFSGAGIFLIAAARRLGDNMGHLSPEERHAYLVERISGTDVDEFACQVAQLSLILADYPNRNGWKIRQQNLFESTDWLDVIGPQTIVFCNPPYERFKPQDRARYGMVIGSVATKAIWVADHLVDRKPAGLALVLPRAFALERGYETIRRKLEAAYDDIEIVALPEQTFSKAGFETCLVIAKSPSSEYGETAALGRLTNTFVSAPDLPAFNRTGVATWSRTRERVQEQEDTDRLWEGSLQPVWEDLGRRCARLSETWTPRRGMEWHKGRQELAWSSEERPNSRRGYHPTTGMMAFQAPRPGWLDTSPEYLRGGAGGLPWQEPKVLLNAARRSRGPWRVTAFVETQDIAASQQFIGLWPKGGNACSLDALAAILNGPVANAFLNEASFGKGLRLEHLKRIPMPWRLDEDALAHALADYKELCGALGFDAARESRLREALLSIDAIVLTGYDLAPRNERLLLSSFARHRRQVPFRFEGFYSGAVPALPLRDVIGGALRRTQWPKLAEAFKAVSPSDWDAMWGAFE